MSFGLENLPALNATLNAASACCVVGGLIQIKRRNELLHRRFMLTAVAFSAAFLVSYLVYHGFAEAKTFAHEGWVRTAYLTMLATHVFLAIVVVPLVLVTVLRGLKDQRPAHRRIVRWTVPIWLYVSVTGVLVYFAVHVWR